MNTKHRALVGVVLAGLIAALLAVVAPPVVNAQCSSDGSDWVPFTGSYRLYRTWGHPGGHTHDGAPSPAIDYDMPVGTPIRAAGAGEVLTSEFDNVEGHAIAIYHAGDNTTSRYIHLDSRAVAVGQCVQAGDIIGQSGATGSAVNPNEPHLHYQEQPGRQPRFSYTRQDPGATQAVHDNDLVSYPAVEGLTSWTQMDDRNVRNDTFDIGGSTDTGCSGARPASGCLVRGDGQPTVFVVAGGAKFPFGTAGDFERAGYSFNDVVDVDQSVLDGLGRLPRGGTLIRESDSTTTVVVAGGSAFAFSTAEDFARAGYSFNDVTVVPENGRSRLSSLPADGTLLRESDSTTTVVVAGGSAFAFSTAEDFARAGYSFNDVTVVPENGRSRLSSLPADGTLLRESDSTTTVVVAGGSAFAFSTAEDFARAGYSFNDVTVVPENGRGRLSSLPADGTLLRESDSTTTVVVAGGSAFAFSTAEDFARAGYSFNDVTVVPENGRGRLSSLPADGTLLRESDDSQVWVVRGGVRAPSEGAHTVVPENGLRNIPVEGADGDEEDPDDAEEETEVPPGEETGPGSGPGAGGVPPAGGVHTSRLAGAGRQQTAAAIALHVFPDGARTVYLAEEGAGHAETLAAGSVTDGPVLLTNGTGEPSQVVLNVIDQLDPARVVALGAATGGVADSMLNALAQGRPTDRIGGRDIYDVAANIALASWPTGADTVYLSEPINLADGVAGGVVLDGPILLVPADGSLSGEVINAIRTLNPDRVVAFGGPAAVSDAVLGQAANGRESDRVFGPTRVETATAISAAVFTSGAPTVYLARADNPVDAVVGGSVVDGPILLVESCNGIYPATATEIRRIQPDRIIALGGTTAICDDTLNIAAGLLS